MNHVPSQFRRAIYACYRRLTDSTKVWTSLILISLTRKSLLHMIQLLSRNSRSVSRGFASIYIQHTDDLTELPQMNQITRQLKIQQTAKNTYVAVCIPVLCSYIYSFASCQHQRSARVREAFLQLYRQVYLSISKQVLLQIFLVHCI